MTVEPSLTTLSPEVNQRIFEKFILPVYFPPTVKASPNPTAVMLGGQPGAGKTKLLQEATARLAKIGHTVAINGDDLRRFHPKYAELLKHDPNQASTLTGPDAGKWVSKLIEAGIRRSTNLVVEGTMRSPEVVLGTATMFRQAGYTVEAHAIAVSERQSWQGTLLRYESMIAETGVGRYVEPAAHTAAAVGMYDTLRSIERERAVDRLAIFDRSGNTLYENTVAHGVWRTTPAAADYLQAARNRPLSEEEQATFSARWTHVITLMSARNAPQQEISQIQDQAQRDAQYFAAQAEIARQQEASQERKFDPTAVLVAGAVVVTVAAKIARSDLLIHNFKNPLFAQRQEMTSMVARVFKDAEKVIGSIDAKLRTGRNPLPALDGALADPSNLKGGMTRNLFFQQKPDAERAAALASIPGLRSALNEYELSIKAAVDKAPVSQTTHLPQIGMPSVALMTALSSRQFASIFTDPTLATEFDSLKASLEARFTPVEMSALKAASPDADLSFVPEGTNTKTLIDLTQSVRDATLDRIMRNMPTMERDQKAERGPTLEQ